MTAKPVEAIKPSKHLSIKQMAPRPGLILDMRISFSRTTIFARLGTSGSPLGATILKCYLYRQFLNLYHQFQYKEMD